MSSRELPARALSDKDLVVEYQAGDPAAYEEMYRRYSSRVNRICLRMLGNAQDADEATQETFLKAFQALPRFNGNYQLGAWLARIASNVCLDQLRSRARSGHLVALPDSDDLAEVGGPEDLITGDGARLQESLHHLQPLHAKALMLRTLEGLSHQEMAGRLAMSPAQVKALLHRARTSFRRAWQKAEGWALAPVLGFRALVAERSRATDVGAPVSGLTGFAPMMNPMLAERVAASAAVIVAAALSGLPSAPPSDAGRSTSRPSAAIAEANRILVPRQAVAQPTRPGVVQAPPARAKEDNPYGDLMKRLHAVVPDHHEHAKKAPKKPDGPDDPGVPVGPAGTKPVQKQVKQILEKLPPPGR